MILHSWPTHYTHQELQSGELLGVFPIVTERVISSVRLMQSLLNPNKEGLGSTGGLLATCQR